MIVALVVVGLVVAGFVGFCIGDWQQFKVRLSMQSRIWELEDEIYEYRLNEICIPGRKPTTRTVYLEEGEPYTYPTTDWGNR